MKKEVPEHLEQGEIKPDLRVWKGFLEEGEFKQRLQEWRPQASVTSRRHGEPPESPLLTGSQYQRAYSQ